MSPRRGATAIEFAVSLPVIVLVAAGITDLSLYLSAVHNVERACRDAARVGAATLDGTEPMGDDIEAAALDHVRTVLSQVNLDPAIATSTASWREEPDGYCYLTVSIDYPFDPPVGMFPSVNDGVQANFTMMTLQQR